MIKNDKWITHMAHEFEMIEPFIEEKVSDGVLSYGLSSFGYDIRVSNKFKIFKSIPGSPKIIDPKNFDENLLLDFEGDICTIPPNSFALAVSIEYIRMPRNVNGIVLGKSTYARCGIVTNFTPLEAGWEGHITIEISNTTPAFCKIYANEGIAQILFFEGEQPLSSYADRKGKYQGQKGITLPKIRRND